MQYYKIHIFSIIMLLFQVAAIAQPPGYQGKRLGFKYGFLTSPATNPTYNFDGRTDNEWLPLNMTHELEAEWVISRQMSLGFVYQYGRTRANNEFDNGVFLFRNVYDDIYGNSRDAFFGLHNHMAGLRLYKYKSAPGHLAPLGKYWFFSLKMSNTLIVDEQLNDKLGYTTGFVVGLGVGEQRIIRNRLLLNINLSVNYLPANLLIAEEDVHDREMYIKREAMKRIRGMIALNLKISVGWLPRF